MKANNYQLMAHVFAIYNQDHAATYPVLGLVNEAGEVAGKVKKYLRGDYDYEELKRILGKELGDVMWYLAETATQYGLNLEDIMRDNIQKLQSRSERGVLQGNGDDR